ncbi:hypothetical protein H6P81_004390 [Aristolochia fimbriata]|uniref:C3H1-type domain-containing protein n=1 Tax=Aristolochia fimbriata TaxID=158543 RepID=A0AAV7FHL9_ARIFI|nr:hypothetical protein H6P81_004390 [Aristolochia fimbriata]
MPVGKYYCDYCDKQFQDTPAARKRHIEGIQHQRAKALWYDSLKEGGARGICNRFVRTGFCQYGDACRYLHPQQNRENPAQVISGDVVRDTYGVSMQNIPPSLRPPPEGGYPPLPFVDWG